VRVRVRVTVRVRVRVRVRVGWACIAEKRRCECRFLATVARRARRTATHTTMSVRKTT